MKKCFITTLGTAENFNAALTQLERSLKNSMSEEIIFQTENLPSMSASIEQFSQSAIPHLLMVDSKEFASPADLSRIETFFTGLRNLDPAVCIIVLWNSNPSANELMNWLDRGATGLYNPESKNPEGDVALLEALAQRVSAQLAREPRASTRHKVRIQLASLEQALAAETLNLGFGGMFLRIQPRDMKTGDEVEFQLEFGGGVSTSDNSPTDTIELLKKMDDAPRGTKTSDKKIEGTGRVVWIRSTQKDGLPEGIGLQFLNLNKEVREQIRNFVVNHRLHAFIPKA